MKTEKPKKRTTTAPAARKRYVRPIVKPQGPLTSVTLTSTSGGGGI